MEYLYLLNVAILAYDGARFFGAPHSTFRFLKLCFSLTVGFGVIFVQVMDVLVGYKFVLRDLHVIEWSYLLGYSGLTWGGWVARAFMRTVLKASPSQPFRFGDAAVVPASSRHGLAGLAALSLVSVVGYVSVTGLSFGQAGYEARYQDAAGMGLFLRFFPAVLPFATYKLMTAKNARAFATVAFWTLAYTFFTYIALKGYRQLFIAALLMVMIIGLMRGFVKAGGVLTFAVVSTSLLIALAFLRYSGESTSSFRDPITAAFYFLQGDVFPVDAILKTYWWCDTRECPGVVVLANHFSALIPRFLWEDKPAILLNAAGYYTQVIVGYDRALTLSATIVGEAFLVGGWLALGIITFSSGFLAKILSIWIERSSGLLRYVLLSNVYMGFFWVREGLASGVYRTMLIIVYFLVALVLAPVVFSFMKGMTGRRASVRD